MIRLATVLVAFGAVASSVSAQAARSDSAAVVAVIERFHGSLAAGDSARAVSVLAEDLMVIEAGAIETRADYLGHHLGADIKASQGSKGERAVLKVTVAGDAAYVVSRTTTPSATAGGMPSESAELMVLTKTGAGWRIRAVHWSSRRRRAS
jgi:ketosteroid isomerase-like protein